MYKVYSLQLQYWYDTEYVKIKSKPAADKITLSVCYVPSPHTIITITLIITTCHYYTNVSKYLNLKRTCERSQK